MRTGLRKLALPLLAAVAAACAGAEDDPGDSESPTPTPNPSAFPTATATPPEMPATIDVGATNVTVSLPFGLSIDGTGTGIAGAVDVAASVGTIAIQGTSFAVAFYEKQPWPEFGYTLYQGLVIGSSRWDVVWAYCNAGAGLAYIWHEGMTGAPLDYYNASGTCTDTGVATSTTVAFPAVSFATPAPVTGFTIDGAEVTLADGEPGLLHVDGAWRRFVVFGTVDCTACGGAGWYELHSVVWDHETDSAAFAIVYLDFATPASVLTAYARSIPDFTDTVGVRELDATWMSP